MICIYICIYIYTTNWIYRYTYVYIYRRSMLFFWHSIHTLYLDLPAVFESEATKKIS